MASVDYKETELWLNAKTLLIETYRLTQGWPEGGKDLAKEIRGLARQIVKSVPNAFKKGGIAGNVHLRMTKGNFAEFEALCEAAAALGIVEPTHFQPLQGLLGPVQAEFSALGRASREHARELMKDRTRLMGGALDDDDDDF
jgi:hypothetical protein